VGALLLKRFKLNIFFNILFFLFKLNPKNEWINSQVDQSQNLANTRKNCQCLRTMLKRNYYLFIGGTRLYFIKADHHFDTISKQASYIQQ
jgi:hypothetical protein